MDEFDEIDEQTKKRLLNKAIKIKQRDPFLSDTQIAKLAVKEDEREQSLGLTSRTSVRSPEILDRVPGSAHAQQVIDTAFTNRRVIDFMIGAFAMLTGLATFFIPHAEIAWLFAIAMLGTLILRHPIVRLTAIIVTVVYFMGIIMSTYYLKISDIWTTLLGSTRIFRYSFLLSSIATLIVFIIGIVSGSKDIDTKGMAVASVGLFSASLAISFIDMIASGYKLLANPGSNQYAILLIDSAGFYLVLFIWYTIFYTISLGLRRIVLKNAELLKKLDEIQARKFLSQQKIFRG